MEICDPGESPESSAGLSGGKRTLLLVVRPLHSTPGQAVVHLKQRMWRRPGRTQRVRKGNTFIQRADAASSAGSLGGDLVMQPGPGRTPLQSFASDREPSPAPHHRPRCCSTVPQRSGRLWCQWCAAKGQKLMGCAGFPCKAGADRAPEPTQPWRHGSLPSDSSALIHGGSPTRCTTARENMTPS